MREAYRAPYRTAERRRAIGGFVADIPVDAAHESHAELQRIAAGVAALTVPALLLWGPRDPIFGDRYLDDLIDRLPHADVHRFEGAGHMIAEERDYAGAILTWLGDRAASPAASAAARERRARRATLHPPPPSPPSGPPSTPAATTTATPSSTWPRAAASATSAGGSSTTGCAASPRASRASGSRRVERVSVLVPPGPTLTAVVYACLRIGAVVVVADAGLGVQGLSRAVRGSWPDVVIGEARGLAAARALGWPGMRVSVARLPRASRRLLGVAHSLGEILERGTGAALPPEPAADDAAAILFTSGSTGPAKGVAYTHRQLSALRDVLAAHFGIGTDTGLVTGFAPFALLGPALGTRSATPDDGRLGAAHPHRARGRGGGAGVRRPHGLPLPRRRAQRRRDGRRPRRRRPPRARDACAPSSPRALPSASRCSPRPPSSCRTPNRTRPTA